MNRLAHVLLLVIPLFTNSLPLQWDANSLLQPGPCPTGHPHLSANVQLLPRDFSKCCHPPSVEMSSDSPMSNQETSSQFTYLPSNWIKLRVDFSSCAKNQSSVQSITTRLWQNALSKESFLVELPWPFNLAGFSTLNILETDYTTFLTGYICHSLLLEHISVPFIMIRPVSNIDLAQLLRLKWSLSKLGIPSAWSLTDIASDDCNELFTSGGKRKNDTLAVHPVNGSAVANETGWKTASTTHNPDSEVEWITSEYESEADDDDAIHFPGDEELSDEPGTKRGESKNSTESEEELSLEKTPHPSPIQ